MASFTQGPTAVVGANLTTVTISWTADVDSYGQVFYGLDPLQLNLNFQDMNFGSSHSVVLSNLQTGQTYTYVVNIQDSNGNTLLGSGNLTFTTSAAPAGTITDGPYSDPSSNGASIAWTASVVGAGLVNMGKDPANLNLVFNDPNVANGHTVTPQGLDPDCQYSYKVCNVDPGTGAILAQSNLLTFKTTSTVTGTQLIFPRSTPWVIPQGGAAVFSVLVHKNNSGVPNELVNFEILSGSGKISSADLPTGAKGAASSDANGVAQVNFKADGQFGIVRVKVSAPSASNTTQLFCLV